MEVFGFEWRDSGPYETLLPRGFGRIDNCGCKRLLAVMLLQIAFDLVDLECQGIRGSTL